MTFLRLLLLTLSSDVSRPIDAMCCTLRLVPADVALTQVLIARRAMVSFRESLTGIGSSIGKCGGVSNVSLVRLRVLEPLSRLSGLTDVVTIDSPNPGSCSTSITWSIDLSLAVQLDLLHLSL